MTSSAVLETPFMSVGGPPRVLDIRRWWVVSTSWPGYPRTIFAGSPHEAAQACHYGGGRARYRLEPGAPADDVMQAHEVAILKRDAAGALNWQQYTVIMLPLGWEPVLD